MVYLTYHGRNYCTDLFEEPIKLSYSLISESGYYSDCQL